MYDVIGGIADGSKAPSWPVWGASRDIDGEPYIALEFSPDPNLKKKTVTIYMRCGMVPLEAMRIWRERNMTNPVYESYKVHVNKLLTARKTEIEGYGGTEAFAQVCEAAREQILKEREWPNRLTLATQLGIKASDAREGRISAGIKKASMPAHTKKESREKSRSPAGTPHPDPYGMAAALPIPGNNPDDPDDAQW